MCSDCFVLGQDSAAAENVITIRAFGKHRMERSPLCPCVVVSSTSKYKRLI